MLFEQLDNGGTLITLDSQIIDANNQMQVAKASRLRNTLISQQLIQV